jgi:hypothetical protein
MGTTPVLVTKPDVIAEDARHPHLDRGVTG